MTILTIDLDTADEIDVLYAIDKLSTLLRDPDPITAALAKVAYDIADGMVPRSSDEITSKLADQYYPQTDGIWMDHERHRLSSTRDAHLRRFGMLSERVAA